LHLFFFRFFSFCLVFDLAACLLKGPGAHSTTKALPRSLAAACFSAEVLSSATGHNPAARTTTIYVATAPRTHTFADGNSRNMSTRADFIGP
jgi:hypothetical protein